MIQSADRRRLMHLSVRKIKTPSEISLMQLPSAEPEWDNYTVACLLAEMFGDDCAYNFNVIGKWLSEKCEAIDSYPHLVGGILLGAVFKAQGRKENR